jgi:DNA-binding transcriptional MerR regulator
MAERTHLSIGEVLSLLREEFPDVTISKIRFLESQGLVDPERTPSGYRKFYDHDVERLRWILRQQRENFLPLKVIRGRLSEVEDPDANGTLFDSSGAPVEDGRSGSEGGDADDRVEAVAAGLGALTGSAAAATGGPGSASGWRPSVDTASSAHPAAASRRSSSASDERVRLAPAPEAAAPVAPAVSSGVAAGRTDPEENDSYSAEELAAAAGSTDLMIRELEQFGLITPHAVVAGTQYYDGLALQVARAAAGFARHGVEARHLKAWRNAAEREAGVFEQVVMPMLRQRNPDARRRAAATLAELSGLGADMRRALIEQAVRQIR